MPTHHASAARRYRFTIATIASVGGLLFLTILGLLFYIHHIQAGLASYAALVGGGVAGFLVLLGVAASLGQRHRRHMPRPDRGLHQLIWPRRGLLRKAAKLVRFDGLRDLVRLMLPIIPPLTSDIADVVYINWMVPAERVRAMLPAPLELDVRNGQTAISILTYRHGNFGPVHLGPLRRIFCASPLQSNWRLYLTSGTIYFFKTCLSNPLYLFGSRWMSDALPSHMPAQFTHTSKGDSYSTHITSGDGSAPDLESQVELDQARTLPGGFGTCFESWDEAVAYLVHQNEAIASRPDLGTLIHAPIAIPIDVANVKPARVVGPLRSAWLETLVEGCAPFVFVVPKVTFTALGENWEPIKAPNTLQSTVHRSDGSS